MARSLVELLEQTTVWRGQDGRVYYVGELEDEHLGAIIAMLNRRAVKLLEHRRWYDGYTRGAPPLDDRALESVDALAWLHDRPLYQRLLAEQRRRGAVDGEVVYPVGDVDANERRALRDRPRAVRERVERVAELKEEHDDVVAVADRVAGAPPSVETERALTELGRLLAGYREAIRRLGEL